MRTSLSIAVAALLAAASAPSCGNDGSTFSGGNGDNGSDDGSCGFFCSDGGDDGPSGPCVNLQCNAAPCAPLGKPETVLRGTVYDPAGNLPLYNIFVYVPNAPPKPIHPGDPECTPCEAPAWLSPRSPF